MTSDCAVSSVIADGVLLPPLLIASDCCWIVLAWLSSASPQAFAMASNQVLGLVSFCCVIGVAARVLSGFT